MPSAYAILTYHDMIQRGLAYLGSQVSQQAMRDVKIAIANAAREFMNVRQWSYYKQLGRIVTVEPQTSSTITYDHTGGANERMITIASGTWPSWAASGVIVIDSIPYTVDTRVSSTVITLGTVENPGADVAAGTEYTLYQDSYDLPADFISLADVVKLSDGTYLNHVDANDWLTLQRSYHGPSTPVFYAITGSTEQRGMLALRLHPPPDDDYSLAFMYHRRPRRMVIDEYTTGTVSVTSGAATVTGSGTTFTSGMVGSVIRLSDDGVNIPTGIEGTERAAQERIITAFTSATSITVDSNFDQTLSGVKYRVSDIVDIEDGAMLAAFEACVYKHLAMIRRMEDRRSAEAEYGAALLRAMEADSRSFAPKTAGPGVAGYAWADRPIGERVT